MQNKTLTRLEIYELVWSKTIRDILKEYALTNTTFKYICSENDIPVPKMGYWQKLKHNKKVLKPPLLETNKTYKNIKLPIRIKGQESITKMTEINLLVHEIKNNKKLLIKVPEKLYKPEKITAATKDYFKRKQKSKYPYKVEEPKEGLLSLSVSDNLVNRGLRFWDTLIKLLIQRGHKVEVVRNHKYTNYNGTKFVIHGEYFDMRLREMDKRVMEESDFNWKTAKYYPTGKLSLKIDNYPRHEWQDTKTKLIEDKLPNIVAYLELSAKKEKEDRIKSEIRRKEQEIIEAKKKAIQKEKDHEFAQLNNLFESASRWHKTQYLRGYIWEFEDFLKTNNSLDSKKKEWINWAKEKADWLDPFVEKELKLLEDIDRDSLKPTHKTYY
ncbi:hypothetical protein ATE84_3998 [Aquimarina sp. MAR_2010_214]|uniref:hypothetical protein n=1 Tax=Aquimarina sp. MAR_2010_214 TaxID=1250026 RepID=UPI000C7000B7|nr:hypothetical protein [Aquimarina sp. MAR_2010_214]PKV51898.1 hypothetical protein ATE84_3998 [Aquimarina sp. MAR_2010_214]